MSWRVVTVSSLSKLDYKMDYLVVRNTDGVKRIHLSEISVLMIESTAVSLTAYLLCELNKRKIDIIFCDERRLERGRTSIDTQESRATIIFERGAANDLFIVAFVELLQFLVVCEKRGQAHYFRALHIAQVL